MGEVRPQSILTVVVLPAPLIPKRPNIGLGEEPSFSASPLAVSAENPSCRISSSAVLIISSLVNLKLGGIIIPPRNRRYATYVSYYKLYSLRVNRRVY